jgi:UDP-2,3-diacylglucosamine pyrophosphatase LpxH
MLSENSDGMIESGQEITGDWVYEIDTMIISDIHLGSEVARTQDLLSTLQKYSFKRLILNGDVFDDLNFRRLSKADWKFLSYIRKLSNPRRNCQVIWVAGNHDGIAEILSHLLGVQVLDEYEWQFNNGRYLAVHGHQFDNFITRHALLTDIASWCYLLLQRADTQQQRMSRWVKRRSKKWLKISETNARRALEYARSRDADFIFCGHTHIPGILQEGAVQYINSGCWTDRPAHYITIDAVHGIRICECP